MTPSVDSEVEGQHEVDLWLDARDRWQITVPRKLPDSALRVLVAYAITIYSKEHDSMPPCQRKRRLGRALEDLIKLRVHQIVKP